jgi:hypothetical protein
MKRYLFIAAFLTAAGALHAQQDLNTAADAVRFATDNITGTARFRAMSGAFGAVGGDLSAIGVNPAGSAIFNYNTGTASLTSYNISNKSNYFGTKTRQNDNSLELNQLGGIFVFKATDETAVWQKLALGFNYENTNNFDNSIFSAGVNPTNSIDQYFLRYANGIGNEGGITLNTLNNAYFEDLNFLDQQAYLGYNAYLFNPVTQDGNNTAYTSNIPSTGNYQENSVATSGYNGKVALNFAGQLHNRLFLGANLNVHFTDYIKTSSLYEEYRGAATELQSVQFNNERYTYGGGFSFNVGAIAKVTEAFRLGLAYESPTWYRLQDELTQSIVANNGGQTVVTNPGTTMVMDDYSIRTPSKYTGSLAYIFGKHGLVSVDYALKDYSNTKFTDDNTYQALNNELLNTLDVASEIRVGAEYRIKNFSLRGGYRFEQSPYKNGNTMGDLTGFSCGLGFAFGNSRLDLAYAYYKRKMNEPFLTAGFTDAARINNVNNNVTLSYSIDL